MTDHPREKPVAVITGASRGIGAETARQLARRGYDLVLAARSEEPLRVIAEELRQLGSAVLVAPTDVQQSAELCRLAAMSLERFGHVDVLLHNAGVSCPGKVVTRLTDEDVRSVIATNLLAPIDLTRALLPSMYAAKRGFIGFMGSTGGHVALPSASLYSCTKFGLRGFAAALRREARPYGVHVCLFSPGFIKTQLSEPVWEIFQGYPMRMGTKEGVARAVVKAITKPRRDVIVPAYNRLFILADRMLPAVVDGVASFYMRRILPRYEARHFTPEQQSPP